MLATGGIRWLAVGDDAVAFVRESADEAVLVFAARAATTLSFEAAALSRSDVATAVFGDAGLATSDGLVTLSATAPTFAVWTLPGVATPAW